MDKRVGCLGHSSYRFHGVLMMQMRLDYRVGLLLLLLVLSWLLLLLRVVTVVILVVLLLVTVLMPMLLIAAKLPGLGLSCVGSRPLRRYK